MVNFSFFYVLGEGLFLAACGEFLCSSIFVSYGFGGSLIVSWFVLGKL
jgi:hypothetical protein